MIVVGTVDRQGFEAALSAARDEGSVRSYPGLSAPLDGSLLGKISEVWESVERALREAFIHGMDYAREALDQAVSSAENLIKNAGVRAKDVHQALLAKLQEYLSRLVDAALSQVRRIIEVGDIQLELDALEVSQRISLTGSIKASLTEIVALTSAGELTVGASYKIAGGTTTTTTSR
jgi:hypothetical protein